jgi:hypothetical protein
VDYVHVCEALTAAELCTLLIAPLGLVLCRSCQRSWIQRRDQYHVSRLLDLRPSCKGAISELVNIVETKGGNLGAMLEVKAYSSLKEELTSN